MFHTFHCGLATCGLSGRWIRPAISPNTHIPPGGFRTESLVARRMRLHKLRMDICGSERKPVCCASMAFDSCRGLLQMESICHPRMSLLFWGHAMGCYGSGCKAV